MISAASSGGLVRIATPQMVSDATVGADRDLEHSQCLDFIAPVMDFIQRYLVETPGGEQG
jgi:hypothetical protein